MREIELKEKNLGRDVIIFVMGVGMKVIGRMMKEMVKGLFSM